MIDQPPTSNAAKATSAGVGAALILVLSLLFRHRGSPPPPRPVTATLAPPPVTTVPPATPPIILPPVLDTAAIATAGPPPPPPTAAEVQAADDLATANRYGAQLGYEYLVGRADIIRRWRNEAPSEDPVVWLAKNGFESWQADCDITTTVPFRPLDVEFQADVGITGVEVSWNPHPHGVDWNTSSETIRQQVVVPRAQQVLGDVPIKLHNFPCVHPPFLFAWYSTSAPRMLTVASTAPFNPGVLHPVSAAAFIGPLRSNCGQTYVDDTGRPRPLVHCTVEEMRAAAAQQAGQQ